MNKQNPLLIALDFDGVICDSVRETAVSGWRAARHVWPADIATPEPPVAVMERFIRLRPYLHTGYEAIPLMRLAMRGVQPSEMTGTDIERAKQEVLAETGLAKKDFLGYFSDTRDEWIKSDEDDWLSRNHFYPGTLEAVEETQKHHEVFIITTKLTRFAEKLLKKGGLSIGRDRIFGLDVGKPKEDILEELRARRDLREMPTHFVEDRLATLRRIEKVPALSGVRLYLCDWGYNTPEDREEAEKDPRINLLHELKTIYQGSHQPRCQCSV
ncbi:MAG: HAD family hydrolase [Lentisphaeria bacterium]